MRSLIRYNTKFAASWNGFQIAARKLKTEDASRKNKLIRRQTACLRIRARRTIQWTRGETACFIRTSFLKPWVARSGFARVISAVRRFLVTLKVSQTYAIYFRFDFECSESPYFLRLRIQTFRLLKKRELQLVSRSEMDFYYEYLSPLKAGLVRCRILILFHFS